MLVWGTKAVPGPLSNQESWKAWRRITKRGKSCKDCQNRKTAKLLLVCKYFIKLLRTDMKAVVSNELLVNDNREGKGESQ